MSVIAKRRKCVPSYWRDLRPTWHGGDLRHAWSWELPRSHLRFWSRGSSAPSWRERTDVFADSRQAGNFRTYAHIAVFFRGERITLPSHLHREDLLFQIAALPSCRSLGAQKAGAGIVERPCPALCLPPRLVVAGACRFSATSQPKPLGKRSSPDVKAMDGVWVASSCGRPGWSGVADFEDQGKS